MDSEIIPPTSTTVVHEMPRWACSTVSTRSTIIAQAASSPATAAGTAPVASSTTIAGQHGERRLRPRAHRHRLAAHELGRVDDQHLRVLELLVERGPGAPQQQRVAPGQHGLADVLALALHGQDHEVAARRHHAREDRVADELRTGRDHDLGDARAAREQVVVRERVLRRERARVVAEVGRERARVALRQQPVAERQRDQDHARDQRHADERELEEAEAAGGVGDDHVDRRPSQRQQRAGVRAEGEREQQP